MVEHIREDGYNEVAVSIHRGLDCVADVYITIDPDFFQPVVYITASGGGNGDHDIIVRPLKDKQIAVEYE